jgi:DNA-damage-inducible protein D
MLSQRNIQPETLAAEEDIRKLERRVITETRKLGKSSPKLPTAADDD